MKKFKLSTQIVVILLVSLFTVPLLLYVFAYPQFQNTVATEIYENLHYQLNFSLASDEEYNNSVFVLKPNGEAVVYDLKKEDEDISVIVLREITEEVHLSKLKENQGCKTLYDGTKIYYVYRKYDDDSAKILVKTSFEKDTIFGNGESVKFMAMIFIFMCLPILLLIVWFNNVSKSIHSIQQSISDDRKTPIIVSKELQNLQDSLDIFKTEIRESTEQKQRLFQNISHELKTPITTIRMYAEGIEDGIFKDGKLTNSTAIIKEETENLLSKVNKIMDLNKLYHVETQAVAITSEKIVLAEVVFDLLELYGKRAPNVRFNPVLERFEWRGNAEMWNTILQNIFDNNIKHGARNINVEIKKNQLLIENDGDKIEAEILDKLFAPFIKGEKGNYGLGLDIVQRSLKILGYSIDVTNTATGVLYKIYVK